MRSPFTDTITIYNRTIANREPVWHRTVVRGVQWTQKSRISYDASGKNIHTTETSITIPVDADAGGKQYAVPKAYLAAADPDVLWTLNAESGEDVIIKGECPWNISDAYTLDDLNNEYGYVSIQAVADNTNREHLKNWKVAAV